MIYFCVKCALLHFANVGMGLTAHDGLGGHHSESHIRGLTQWFRLQIVPFTLSGHTEFDYRYNMRLTAGVTGLQEMLTPPRHLILLSHLTGFRVALRSILYLLFGLWIYFVYLLQSLYYMANACLKAFSIKHRIYYVKYTFFFTLTYLKWLWSYHLIHNWFLLRLMKRLVDRKVEGEVLKLEPDIYVALSQIT
jgi:hypothetical protein